MSTPNRPVSSADISLGVCPDGVFEAVRAGYQAVYRALDSGPTFDRIWRATACRGDFPEEFAHISFLTLREGARLLKLLAIGQGSLLVDVACGAGGPGLWAARESGASLIGIDPATAGLDAAQRRASEVGLADRSRFELGTFTQIGLPDQAAEAVMSVEALQYAPDKQAAFDELFRVLRPGGRLGVICFEVDPSRVDGVPILGVDPVVDYRPLLARSGFALDIYEETPGWTERVYGVFAALLDAADIIRGEMGEEAAAAVLAEAELTVSVRPYPRRILAVGHRRS